MLAFKKYASVSRCMIVRHPLCAAVGWIHAANVIADDQIQRRRRRHTAPRLLDPLKLNAAAVLARGTHVAPVIVPVFPFPDTSATVVPDPLERIPRHQPAGGGGARAVVADATFE